MNNSQTTPAPGELLLKALSHLPFVVFPPEARRLYAQAEERFLDLYRAHWQETTADHAVQQLEQQVEKYKKGGETLAGYTVAMRRALEAAKKEAALRGYFVPEINEALNLQWNSFEEEVQHNKQFASQVATRRDRLHLEFTAKDVPKPLKVYVASSWRNTEHPQIVEMCRAMGFEVYDFKNPPGGAGFGWESCAVEGKDWREWTQAEYLQALQHPIAIAGFESDMNALKACHICVMVWPAGVSAAMELGYAAGAGKITAVYGAPREPDLMVKMADYYAASLEDLHSWLAQLQGVERCPK